MNIPVVLASASPRRRELLSLLIGGFTVQASGVDETPYLKDATAGSVEQAALAKGRDVADRCVSGTVVIAADTVISFEGRLLGKPSGPGEAAGMLRELRGDEHSVITGAAILFQGKVELFHEKTLVRMRHYSNREIEEYVATGEPLDKAGAYAIQGIGGSMVESIRGCYPNVIGFPLCAVARQLGELGIVTRPVPEVCPARIAGLEWNAGLQTGS